MKMKQKLRLVVLGSCLQGPNTQGPNLFFFRLALKINACGGRETEKLICALKKNKKTWGKSFVTQQTDTRVTHLGKRHGTPTNVTSCILWE